MPVDFKDVNELREVKKAEIIAAVQKAFNNRELNLEKAKQMLVGRERKNIAEAKFKGGDLMINTGKFVPWQSMAMTYDSHDYPFLLEVAWNKIQQESGMPIDNRPDLILEVKAQIKRMLREEYHHAVPIEGHHGVERCFGVMFYEEEGEYGILPIMGFGGEMDIVTYDDIFTAPKNTSDYDKAVVKMVKAKL